jgi:hypothetical protein
VKRSGRRDDGGGPLAACIPHGHCPRSLLSLVKPIVASLTIEYWHPTTSPSRRQALSEPESAKILDAGHKRESHPVVVNAPVVGS